MKIDREFVKMAKRKREYQVVSYDPNKWAVVRNGDTRPVGEHLYTAATHAHRARRRLERAAKKINEMIKRDGAIIL